MPKQPLYPHIPGGKSELTLEEFAAGLGWKPNVVLLRLRALKLARTCGRCGGGGEYSFNLMYGTVCFKCSGLGVELPQLTNTLLQRVQDAVAAGGLNVYFADNKARVEARKAVQSFLDKWGQLPAVLEVKNWREVNNRSWQWSNEQEQWTNGYASTLFHTIENYGWNLESKHSTEDQRRMAAQRIMALNELLLKSPHRMPTGRTEIRNDYDNRSLNVGIADAKADMQRILGVDYENESKRVK